MGEYKFNEKENIMEKKLNNLFDLQRFEKNHRLQNIIENVEEKYEEALDDDEIAFLNAGVDVFIEKDKEQLQGMKNVPL